MKKVAVLGSGAWGTTLGQVMVDSGQQVLIWGRNKKSSARNKSSPFKSEVFKRN